MMMMMMSYIFMPVWDVLVAGDLKNIFLKTGLEEKKVHYQLTYR